MRRELERLARRIAAGDVESARRAVEILEAGRGEDPVRGLMERVMSAASAAGDDPSGSIRSALLETVEDIGLSGGSVPPPWIREYGLEWHVPWLVLRLVDEGIAQDTSWRNDGCPSFGREFDVGGRKHFLMLLSDHPVRESREHRDIWRFAVRWDPPDGDVVVLMETDNPGMAVMAFRQAVNDLMAGTWPRGHGR